MPKLRLRRYYGLFTTASILLFTATSLSGCMRLPYQPPIGSFFSQQSFPLDLEYQTDLGEKKGESQSSSVLWLVAWGSASVVDAAEDGNITVVKNVDARELNVFLGIYRQLTIQVTGD